MKYLQYYTYLLKKLHISRAAQFKPMSFKGQLQSKQPNKVAEVIEKLWIEKQIQVYGLSIKT